MWLPHQATEENFTLGTLKAFPVSLVEPVAYLLLKESYSDVWHSAEKCHPRGLAKEANTVRETFQVSAPLGKENDSGTSSTPKFCQATPRLRLAWTCLYFTKPHSADTSAQIRPLTALWLSTNGLTLNQPIHLYHVGLRFPPVMTAEQLRTIRQHLSSPAMTHE